MNTEMRYIAKIVADIIIENKNKLDNEYNGNGGYEGWFQVELAQKFRNEGYIVEREKEYPYTDKDGHKKYCDIVITNPQSNKKVYIELKAGTCYRVTAEDFIDDAFKLAQLTCQGDCGFAIRISKTIPSVPNGAVAYIVDKEAEIFGLYNREVLERARDPYFLTIAQVIAQMA